MVYRVKVEVTTFVRLLVLHKRLRFQYKFYNDFADYCISAC